MANTNNAFGGRVVRLGNAANFSGGITKCFVPASDGTALFVGDPVILAGSGDALGTCPSITIATAGATNYVIGFIDSFVADYDNQSTLYRTASTARYVNVITDSYALFEIQEDSVGGALAITNIGQNINLIAGSGSTSTGLSGWMIDSSSANTTNDIQMRIVGLSPAQNNVVGNYAKWLCRINLHQDRNLTGI